VPGKAKTRLIPALGPAGAARFHRRMTEDAVAITVCYTGARCRDFRAWLGPDLRYEHQQDGTLGARMRQAFARAFADGASAVLATGTDIPGMSPHILSRSLQSLRDSDTVLGPAADGGYYLIGMKRLHPALFSGMDWGTERVYSQTCAVLRALGLTVETLPALGDVDRPEDLPLLRGDPRFADLFSGRSGISVIIPTLNEAAVLGQTLQSARSSDGVEIIVADGGSRDRTREIAAGAGALFLEAAGGRAAQLNAGAAMARGPILLFLHADSLLPEGYAGAVRAALEDPATVAGAFRFRTDWTGTAMRLVEWGTNIRSARLQLPYGDQGLFLEKRLLAELGGFAPLSIMEDFDLVRRLRRRGRIVTLRDEVVTSARRWKDLGFLRTLIVNQIMIAGYFLGLPNEALRRLYRRGAGRVSPHRET
jgi:rSAM/selenodomain-associated transferase 2/rSAM/selenodomain-associated transferase 1